MKVIDMKVVLFTDLDGHEDIEIEHFTFGDAEYTLVTPAALITEIEGCCGEHEKLLEQLRNIPETVLVAVQG